MVPFTHLTLIYVTSDKSLSDLRHVTFLLLVASVFLLGSGSNTVFLFFLKCSEMCRGIVLFKSRALLLIMPDLKFVLWVKIV